MVTRKNTDYTASAVNLCNPPEVKTLLDVYAEWQGEIDNLDMVLRSMPEYEKLTERQQNLASLRKEIEMAVETHGSYQDVDIGRYGLKQRAVSIQYKADEFEKTYPQFVPVVLTKSVNVDALKGLIKGGLIHEADLKSNGITLEKESFRFIILEIKRVIRGNDYQSVKRNLINKRRIL